MNSRNWFVVAGSAVGLWLFAMAQTWHSGCCGYRWSGWNFLTGTGPQSDSGSFDSLYIMAQFLSLALLGVATLALVRAIKSSK